uniref:Putative WW-binding domain-containing protein n=1 Tax=Mastacembelus armatus TaxID=205130 RepID=A0A7N8WLX3_9TELE
MVFLDKSKFLLWKRLIKHPCSSLYCTYNSFQYWRVPLPELDLSLLEDASDYLHSADQNCGDISVKLCEWMPVCRKCISASLVYDSDSCFVFFVFYQILLLQAEIFYKHL